MTDVFDPAKRSAVMARIRSSGTKPEDHLHQIVRAIVGGRRRVIRNAKGLPGRPDLFIPSFNLAIFLDGCFYHGCPIHGHIPKSNTEYWSPKIARNIGRDHANARKLRRMGYRVWRIWEHAIEGRRAMATTAILQRRFKKILES
jgi:DNA mismatch endonuclease, patch repair protein